ncbi:MAG TPA: glycosyltransferase family 2 protein [Terracidiphilus sp.]|jgi:glycosyltransferase involved in cell wall biosynthesis
MEGKADIAVIILAYNESLHLARALRHIHPFAKQVFVIDSYSTDDTVEIAKSFGAHVLQHPFLNYARQFQWALDQAPITAEWVLRLDADEIIEADLCQEIVERLPQLAPDITGVYLNRKTIFMNKFIRHGGRFPLKLLRIWRRGKARIEDRWMDEHMYLLEGKSITFKGGFADHCLIDLSMFTDKHNKYASREALDVVSKQINMELESAPDLSAESKLQQVGMKRFIKEKMYNRIPFELSAFGYFVYRYVFRLGFLDGREGLIYHLLQGFWYRFLVGAKVQELERALKCVSSKDEVLREIARLTRQKVVSE